ncbi:MAG: acyl-CoA reductase [Bacteroidetes bacterium]|nr:MAG: acyl-CoA reductase [Bacteroidota bacterium]
MKRDQLISTFSQLGMALHHLGSQDQWPGYASGLTEEEFSSLKNLIQRQKHHNAWFTELSINRAFMGWADLLQQEKLESWVQGYNFSQHPKRIGIIMAGNIPLVGFHDLLSVLMTGHHAVVKMSSDDQLLIPALFELLEKYAPEIRQRIELQPQKLQHIDAIIATGSNNSMGYFESYFGKYPHIFRKNRTSVAILDGSETDEELEKLGDDIFQYFGLGCRNISQLLIPKDFDLDRFFGAIIGQQDVIHHHKYANNYDYNRAMFLMNQVPVLENGFLLLRESDELFSPLAVVYYHRYRNEEEINSFLNAHREDIQAIVSKKHIPFGQAQAPGLTDYADGIDTLQWLSELA